MSQMVTRKGAVGDEKDNKKADTPVKDMKKKMAANAEKEKQANEKQVEKTEKTDKQPEKKDKSVEKRDHSAEKKDKKVERKDSNAEKDKKDAQKEKEKTEKKEAPVEKKEEAKAEKSGKTDKPEEKKKPEAKQAKQNGASKSQNGVAEVPSANGSADALNGSVVADDDDADDEPLVIDDDEVFPELAYDDSDVECFEPPTPDGPSRSFTRRSQVKVTRTPETPRPASERAADEHDDPKEPSKLLKLKEDGASDRKLRSSDSPKPDSKKPEDGEKEKDDKSEKVDVDLTMEVEDTPEPRKPDTNYSKSRVKVSPYRRGRGADVTLASVQANYTGNNSTMEMDITSGSLATEAEDADGSYLSALRGIRGRRSYKLLRDVTYTHRDARLARTPAASPAAHSAPALSAEHPSRPTGTVVGRKRKPEPDVEVAVAADEALLTKRMRLLDRIALPFRRALPPRVPVSRTAEIVGINTDLPLTAPVSPPESLESLKTVELPAGGAPDVLPAPPALAADTPPASPASPAANKRCIVM